jgi:large subunit ribosomal protein L23
MSIIIKPIITEKATSDSELNNYGPERKTKFTKTGIQHGKTNALKKAIVQVADGDVIDFYSNL